MPRQTDRQTDRRLILSIQALRAIAFLLIFLGHCFVIPSGFSAFAVSVFIVLSGFLMELNYEDRNLKIGIKAQIFFAWNKIKKLYPLHIICMLSMLVFAIRGMSNWNEVLMATGKVFLNTILLQSWFPSIPVSMSLNGVAWYLSTCLFLYFMFPLISRIIKKYNGIKTSVKLSIAVFLLMLILRVFAEKINGIDGTFPTWFSYCFPVYRLGDFFIGCNLGYIVRRCQINSIGIRFTILEFVSFILCFVVSMIQSKTYDNPVFRVLFTSTIIDLPISVLIVYLFYKNYGLLSKILTNQVLIWLGNMSPYLFLIHYAAIACTKALCSKLFENTNSIIIVIISLLLSVLAALTYQIIQCKVRRI